MPRFYFHVTHDDPEIKDTEGIELPDRKAAWAEATRACGEMIQEIDGQLAVGTDWKMKVFDDAGPIFEITFGARDLR